MFEVMLNKFVNQLKALIPNLNKNEEISFSRKNILEILFYKIMMLYYKGIEPEKENDIGTKNFFAELISIFIVLFFVTSLFFSLPELLTPKESINEYFILEMILIVFFISASWTGFVYFNNTLRDLIKTKILPTLKKRKNTPQSELYKFIRIILNGWCFEWQSGKTIHFYIRSLFLLIFIFIFFIAPTAKSLVQLLPSLYIYQNLNSLASLVFFIFEIILAGFFAFIILYTIITVGIVFIYLFLLSSVPLIEINPMIEMGGTEKYGKIIIIGIYLISFSLATVPLLLLTSSVEKINKEIFSQFENQTIGNLTSTFKSSIINSIQEVTFSKISSYYPYFFIFFISILAAIIIIYLIHTQIKQKKTETLQIIEDQIENIDFLDMKKNDDLDRNQYLLYLHEKVVNSSEWPIKKIFIVEIIFSAIPLIISFIV